MKPTMSQSIKAATKDQSQIELFLKRRSINLRANRKVRSPLIASKRTMNVTSASKTMRVVNNLKL